MIKRFGANLAMLFVLLAYMGGVILIFFITNNIFAFQIGIPIAIVYSFGCFFSKQLRTQWTVVLGILSIVNAIYWLYLLNGL
jgi:hypothetical protein